MEECIFTFASRNEVLRGDPEYCHDSLKLLLFGLSWNKGGSCVELVDDTSIAPHVDLCCVLNSQHYLRCSVESGLNVSVVTLVLEAARPEIDKFDAWLIDRSQQDILWLNIAMHDFVFWQIHKGDKYLDCKSSCQVMGKALKIIVFNKLIQINAQ